MITIRITILLAFSLKQGKVELKRKGAKQKKNKRVTKSKSTDSKKSKASKSDKLSSKKGKSKKEKLDGAGVCEKPKHLIEVGKPLLVCRVEYELIPTRPKYQIDVVCWGSVAMVSTKDDKINLKSYIKNEVAWVPITVKHKFNQLNDGELHRLHEHIVDYTLSIGPKISKSVKSVMANTFFIRVEDIDSNEKFVRAYDSDPNIKQEKDEKNKELDKLEEKIKSVLWECADTPGSKDYNEIVTRLEFLSDSLHRYQINKIIDRNLEGKGVECKDLVPICPPPLTDEDIQKQTLVAASLNRKKNKIKVKNEKSSKNVKKVGKGSSKSIKRKKGKEKKEKKKGGPLKVQIPGEVFFTDPELSIYDLKNAAGNILCNAFIMTTVKNLLTKPQKYSLNPLIIKVKKITNVPTEILQNHRFNGVYVYYNVPYIARCSTVEKSLNENIKFNEAHAYFTEDIPKIKLLEFLQSQRLYVEIRGVREKYEKPLEPKLFGFDKNDANLSKKLSIKECSEKLKSKEEPSTVTLAVACYDISSLLKPARGNIERASCHHPDTMCFQPLSCMYQHLEFTDIITTNELNLNTIYKPKAWSPLSESILTDFGMTLTVEVYLSAPYNAYLEVSKNPNIYHRMFVIFNNTELAANLLNIIFLHNQEVLGPELWVSNVKQLYTIKFDVRPTTAKDNITDFAHFSSVLTGFLIENGNSCALFLEGLANGLFPKLWNYIMYFNTSVLKIFYNSDLCFEKRLYWEFIKYGGICMVCLKVPLEKILAKHATYLEGNIPIPCWKAILKLNLLLQCDTLKSMIQYCIFPTSEQLISLNLEWGVPFKWRQRENIDEILKVKEVDNKSDGSSNLKVTSTNFGDKFLIGTRLDISQKNV